MKLYFKILFLSLISINFSNLYSQCDNTPNFISSYKVTATGLGTAGMPDLAVTVPSGNNMAMVIFMDFERDQSTSPGNNWPYTIVSEDYLAPDLKFNGVNKSSKQTKSHNFSNTGALFFADSDFAGGTIYSIYHGSTMPSPGTLVISPSNFNYPKNTGDEYAMTVVFFENVSDIQLNVNRLASTTGPTTSNSLTANTVSASLPSGQNPLLTVAQNVLLTHARSNSTSNLQGTSGWTSIENYNISNNAGTINGLGTERDGMSGRTQYNSGSNTYNITYSRGTGTNGHTNLTIYGVYLQGIETTSGSITSNSCGNNNIPVLESTASGAGQGTITYRWEKSISPFTNWTTIAGATSETYTEPSAITQNTKYRRYALSSFGCESIASNEVKFEYSVDSDGDGIFDCIDIDKDNDGILDTNEKYSCVTNVATPTDPNPSASASISGVNIVYTESGGNVNTVTDASVGFAGMEPSQGSTVTYNFSIPVSNLKMWYADLDNREYLKINYYDENNNRISNLINYVSDNVGATKIITSDSNFGLLIDPLLNLGGNTAVQQYVEVTTPIKVKKIEVTLNAVRADGTPYPSTNMTADIYIKGLCVYGDTDGDGLPDYLDLDSDGDSCSDAVEGAANISTSQLVTAAGTVSGGSTSINQNLCALTTCVNTSGLPQFTTLPTGYSNTTGQAVGTSQDKTINPCFCYKPGIINTGNIYPAKQGITALGRAGVENDNWPMIRQSAWTVLESKEKGFVVNRVATTAALANITNPVEGMMVYDEQTDCLKIYTLKEGDTAMTWHCFITPACPD